MQLPRAAAVGCVVPLSPLDDISNQPKSSTRCTTDGHGCRTIYPPLDRELFEMSSAQV
jgi:hypothetical protein